MVMAAWLTASVTLSAGFKSVFCRCPYLSREASARWASAAIVRTASTGYAPFAVSPESMTAEVPSKIAFATSLTSARVGTGLRSMESSIWVAVMTGLPARTVEWMIRF